MLRSFTRSFTSTVVKRDFARAQLFGRVGNVDFRESESGTKYVTYSVAVNRYDRESNDNVPTWYRVVAFDPIQIDRLEKILKVGRLVHVDAALRVRRHEDPETHKFTSEISLVQTGFDIASYKKRTEGEGEGEGENSSHAEE
ncbi:telomere-binding protein, putative [Candida dubliniensis CD36]|uniref:Single-stranded DNA-binding protein n=1 Tax=Candida dubliniensis (strain CD36 / ATCC MYA-646 / CBS 7987 / NCPF 3949 / NRRL Y-17841) TaxID=573826 RepID=B9W7Y1_CANDC|nr:telomere-binding protein, putative [Candida dubliniensis CD36]CAX44794.1 telomere-binding protein, putative [Candida dubliniensis CD36]